MNSKTKLVDYLYCSARENSKTALLNRYSEILEALGFDQFGTYLLNKKVGLNDDGVEILKTVSLNNWEEYYFDCDYFTADYFSRYSFVNSGAISWDEVAKKETLSPLQNQIIREAEEAKLFNGVTVPFHTPGSLIVTSASSSEKAKSLPPFTKDRLNIVTEHFQLCYHSIGQTGDREGKQTLSPKEKDILKWASNGLTKAEIGFKLNISIHTVDYHSRNILRKLDARNFTNALLIAIKDQHI